MSDKQQRFDRSKLSKLGIIALILAILFLVVGVLATVTATASDANRLIYIEKEDGTLEVESIKDTYRDGWFCKLRLTIPEEVNGKQVTSLARFDSAKVEEVILPQSLVEIKSGAFSECVHLKEVHFERTDGWTVTKNKETERLTGLEDPVTAAEWLKGVHVDKDWNRS